MRRTGPAATSRVGTWNKVGRPATRRAVIVLAVVGLAGLTACQPTPTPVPGAPACSLFPADSYWHADVSHLPVHSRSATYVSNIGSGKPLKADFGSGQWAGGPIGIPFTTVAGSQPAAPITFAYADESDPGPYRIPQDAPIEGGPQSDGDRHVLVVDRDRCVLQEIFDAHRTGSTWTAGSGAVYDLRSNRLRPAGWTSADAAGLPILPGLVRYDEVAAGRVDHAVRITVPRSQRAYLWPARHFASSSTDPGLPPMGLWLRLKSTVDIDRFPPEVRPILAALRSHGAIVADNGSPWFMSGVPDPRWDNDALATLGQLQGGDFGALDTSSLVVSPGSGQVRSP